MKNLTFRIENLSLVTLFPKTESETIQILKHFEAETREACIVVAYWLKDGEGFELKFVGNRPFASDVSKQDFWKLCEIGQKFLDEYFETSETES